MLYVENVITRMVMYRRFECPLRPLTMQEEWVCARERSVSESKCKRKNERPNQRRVSWQRQSSLPTDGCRISRPSRKKRSFLRPQTYSLSAPNSFSFSASSLLCITSSICSKICSFLLIASFSSSNLSSLLLVSTLFADFFAQISSFWRRTSLSFCSFVSQGLSP